MLDVSVFTEMARVRSHFSFPWDTTLLFCVEYSNNSLSPLRRCPCDFVFPRSLACNVWMCAMRAVCMACVHHLCGLHIDGTCVAMEGYVDVFFVWKYFMEPAGGPLNWFRPQGFVHGTSQTNLPVLLSVFKFRIWLRLA